MTTEKLEKILRKLYNFGEIISPIMFIIGLSIIAFIIAGIIKFMLNYPITILVIVVTFFIVYCAFMIWYRKTRNIKWNFWN